MFTADEWNRLSDSGKRLGCETMDEHLLHETVSELTADLTEEHYQLVRLRIDHDALTKRCIELAGENGRLTAEIMNLRDKLPYHTFRSKEV